jgi:hypothetical protein
MPAKSTRSFSSIQNGYATVDGSGVATVTFSTSFDRLPVVQIIDYDATAAFANVEMVLTSITKADFTVQASAGSFESGQRFYWTAIG